jgi:hypothetical protein
MGVGGQRHAPAALPPGKTRYPLCRILNGFQGWSGRVRKISIPPGFDPRAVQPVESRNTDWAIAAPLQALHVRVISIRLKTPLHWSQREQYFGTRKVATPRITNQENAHHFVLDHVTSLLFPTLLLFIIIIIIIIIKLHILFMT